MNQKVYLFYRFRLIPLYSVGQVVLHFWQQKNNVILIDSQLQMPSYVFIY